MYTMEMKFEWLINQTDLDGGNDGGGKENIIQSL